MQIKGQQSNKNLIFMSRDKARCSEFTRQSWISAPMKVIEMGGEVFYFFAPCFEPAWLCGATPYFSEICMDENVTLNAAVDAVKRQRMEKNCSRIKVGLCQRLRN